MDKASKMPFATWFIGYAMKTLNQIRRQINLTELKITSHIEILRCLMLDDIILKCVLLDICASNWAVDILPKLIQDYFNEFYDMKIDGFAICGHLIGQGFLEFGNDEFEHSSFYFKTPKAEEYANG